MNTLALQHSSGLTFLMNILAGSFHSVRAVSENIGEVSDPWSDEALVDAVVNRNSQHHFRMLLARYKTRVHYLSLSVLGPAHQSQAEDAAQEIFLKLYQRLDTFRGDCKFSTWLYRIAINTAIDYRRKNFKFETDNIDDIAPPDALLSAPVSLDNREGLQRVQQAILELPDTQRMMVYQYYWLELKMREIAEILGCPEGTVKVYLLRARKVLAEKLGDLQHA